MLVSGHALTQEQPVKASGYSAGLVSSSLSRLEELGFVASGGRRGRKRLYVAAMSFVDALQSYLRRFVDVEITQAVDVLSSRVHEIKDTEQRSNTDRILEEYRKARVFIDTSLNLMKKHKHLHLEELKQVLPR